MQTHHDLSARHTDRTPGLSRSARYYAPRLRDNSVLIEAIKTHLKDNPGYGSGLRFDEDLQPKGFGKKRSWRVSAAMSSTGHGHRPERIREPLTIPDQASHT